MSALRASRTRATKASSGARSGRASRRASRASWSGVGVIIVSQELEQLSAAPRDSSLQGAERHVQYLGGLAVRMAEHQAQHHRGAIGLLQPGERILDDEVALGIAAVGLLGGLAGAGISGKAAAAAALVHQEGGPADPEQPAAVAALAGEGGGLGPGGQEGLLSEVVGAVRA